MDIEFATSRLREAGRSRREAIREFGVAVGRRYYERLEVIQSAAEFERLYDFTNLRLHQLSGSRAGQYGITLTANFRLIVERTNAGGVRVLSVEDYH